MSRFSGSENSGSGAGDHGPRRGRTGGSRENTLPREEEENRLRFHYQREDRLKLAGNSVGNVDQRPWYRKNKGTLILLLDVSIIVIIFIIYNAFLRPNLGVNEFGDHRYELRAVEFADEILVTLRIAALNELIPGSAGLLELAAYREDLPDQLSRASELLPDQPGQDRIIRLRLPGPVPDDRESLNILMQIDVQADGDRDLWDFSLTAPVELE